MFLSLFRNDAIVTTGRSNHRRRTVRFGVAVRLGMLVSVGALFQTGGCAFSDPKVFTAGLATSITNVFLSSVVTDALGLTTTGI